LVHDLAEPGELDHLRAKSRLWQLYRAWYILMAAPDVGTALTHKILHHKLPALAPLLDGKTEPVLRRVAEERGLSSSWAVILADIQTQPDAFERLDAYFASLASARPSRRLTRLRIHDILVWSEVTSRREDAANLGRNLPNR
jgi:hypothetical protein